MNTKLMAKSYIRNAKDCLDQAYTSLERGNYPLSVRRAQECVELSLKSVLRSIAIEYPREHDVSKALEIVKGKFPDWFLAKIPEFREISRDLSKKRGPALYGYEAELKPASAIFSRTDAEEALASAEEVFNACNTLVIEIFGETQES
jgi:hypothetical protein